MSTGNIWLALIALLLAFGIGAFIGKRASVQIEITRTDLDSVPMYSQDSFLQVGEESARGGDAHLASFALSHYVGLVEHYMDQGRFVKPEENHLSLALATSMLIALGDTNAQEIKAYKEKAIDYFGKAGYELVSDSSVNELGVALLKKSYFEFSSSEKAQYLTNRASDTDMR